MCPGRKHSLQTAKSTHIPVLQKEIKNTGLGELRNNTGESMDSMGQKRLEFVVVFITGFRLSLFHQRLSIFSLIENTV
jgi:hypothetical protein